MRTRLFRLSLFLFIASFLATTPAAAVTGFEDDPSIAQDVEVERPQVAVSSRGDRLVVWYTKDDVVVQGAFISADGTPGEILNLSEPGTAAGYPRVAFDSFDRATVVWYVTGDDALSYVQSRRIGADRQLGPVQTLSVRSENCYYPELAVHRDGTVTVGWENETGAGPGKIQIARLANDSEGTPSGSVVTLDDSGFSVGDLDLAIDSQDRVVAAWARFDGDVDERGFSASTIRAVRVSPDGVPGGVEHVSRLPSIDSRYPAIAIDSSDRVRIAWTSFGAEAEVRTAQLDPDSFSPGEIVIVSDPGRSVNDNPVMAMDGQGRATIAWVTEGSGQGFQLESVRIGSDNVPEPRRVRSAAMGFPRDRLAAAADSLGRVTIVFPESTISFASLSALRIEADGLTQSTRRLVLGDVSERLGVAIDPENRATVAAAVLDILQIRRSLPSASPPNSVLLASPVEDGVAVDTTPTFDFISNSGEASFSCSMDGGSFVPCIAPLTLPKLASGTHTLSIRCEDADGAELEPEIVTFVVDSSVCRKATKRLRLAKKGFSIARASLRSANARRDRVAIQRAKRRAKKARARLENTRNARAEVC